MNVAVNPLFSVTMALRKQLTKQLSDPDSINPGGETIGQPTEASLRAKRNWRLALKGLSTREDPWSKLNWNSYPEERALRHRYNALTKKWKQDNVVVKIETESFGKGAMRECFRM